MAVIERNIERTDLPLIVIPNGVPTLEGPFLHEIERLDGMARVRMFTGETDLNDHGLFIKRSQGADAVVVLGFHVTDDIFDAISGTVKCMAFGGTGIANYVNIPRANEMGIRLCNVRHYGDQSVAEHALALMFELAKRTGRMDVRMHDEGGWEGFDAIQLCGKTVGIVGFGGIGSTTARMCTGLGMDVIEWSHRSHADEAAAMGVREVATLEQLFDEADIVSLHLALNPQTEGIIGSALLDRLSPGNAFINTARSQLVAPGALLRRLEQGDVAAGLDVFDTEPLPDDDPLRSLPNVVLTPHNAWRTDGASRGIARQVVDSLIAWIKGEDYNVVS